MNKKEIKKLALEREKEFIDKRSNGEYEITPKDIYEAVMYGFELATKESQTPLTNEIIKKNGFTIRDQNEQGYVHWEIEEPEYIEIKNYNGIFELVIWNYSDIAFEKDVKFVEDVQKALDACDVPLRFKA